MSEDSVPAEPEAPRSGRAYRTVALYWPRVAVGLVATVGVVEFVVGGLTADSRLQFYVFAWATTTGGLWFLFDKAETATAPDVKRRTATWLMEAGRGPDSGTLSHQFVEMFDRLFGAQHFSGKCLQRSAMASVVAVVVATAIRASWNDDLSLELSENLLFSLALMALFSFVTNVIPNYVSLLQTRWTIAWTADKGVLVPVLTDLLLTSLVSLVWILSLALVVDGTPPSEQLSDLANGGLPSIWFFSGFFTSVWLWLYVASVMASRVMVRMGGGVGFLLRVADVEHQPFRSLGFVSVLVASVIFALGMPLVLL